ncbi:helix-turn-helix domain-containing protein, partial [Streptococcus sp. ZJ93]
MSKRSPKSVEEKLEIVCLLLHQEQSLTQLSKHYQVDHQTIQSWKMKYEEFGIDGLKESRTWKHYSSELK